MKKKDTILRGEVYYADLDGAAGHEQTGQRPVLILQNDTGNRHSPTTIVAAVTSAEKKCLLPTHIRIRREGKLPQDSIVMCEQIRTLDKGRLKGRLMALDRATMKSVDNAVRISLGVKQPPRRYIGTKNGESVVMCLCPRCAKQFYDSEQHTIKRTDPDQTVKDHCDWCSVRFGYDYTISSKNSGDVKCANS